MGWRDPYALLLAAVGSASVLLYWQHWTMGTYPYVFLPLFALYGVVVLATFRKPRAVSYLPLIVGFALVFRLMLVVTPVTLSSDLYRYVWDGRVQRAGLNPYLYPPNAETLAALRDVAIFPHINRPNVPTIYPPGAQMLFALITAIAPDSVTGMKAVMMLFDLATLGLLITLLRSQQGDANRVVVYAWSPLVIFEFASSGHVDVLMLPFLLLALLIRRRGGRVGAGVLLALATLIKLYPAVLLPALYKRREALFPVAFGVTCVGGYVPYVYGAGPKVIGYLPGYFAVWEDFNVGLRHWLTLGLAFLTSAARPLAMALLAAALVAVAVAVSRQDTTRDLLQRAYRMVSAYFLLLPSSFYPWYLICLLPFLCFYPRWGWFYLSGAIALSYWLYYVQGSNSLSEGILLIEFLPLYALLLAQAGWPYLCRRRRARTATPETS